MVTRKCFQDLVDALQLYLTSRSSQQSGTARSGYCNRNNTLIAVCDDNVYTLKAEETEWVRKTSSVGKWLQWSSACMTDGIVITGGYCNKPSSQCWKFAIPTMKWTALPYLNVARHLHATVCAGNQVYVLGDMILGV